MWTDLESVPSNVIQGWQPVACHTHATSRLGGHRLYTIFLFQLSPKVGKNPNVGRVEQRLWASRVTFVGR
jgi:hypothetical protein